MGAAETSDSYGRETEAWCYVGRKNDGEICAVIVAQSMNPQRPDPKNWNLDVAKEIAKWTRQGLVIDRVPIEWFREHGFSKDRWTP